MLGQKQQCNVYGTHRLSDSDELTLLLHDIGPMTYLSHPAFVIDGPDHKTAVSHISVSLV